MGDGRPAVSTCVTASSGCPRPALHRTSGAPGGNAKVEHLRNYQHLQDVHKYEMAHPPSFPPGSATILKQQVTKVGLKDVEVVEAAAGEAMEIS